MSEPTFEAFTRRFNTVVSRRKSVLALGATAATAATARPSTARAGCVDLKRRMKERCRRSKESMCQRQKSQCINVANAFCNGALGCVASVFPCCDALRGDCNVTTALECLLAVN